MEKTFKYLSPKLKMCASYNGIEHQAYIYKHINGKPYCKYCAMVLQPPKSIKRVSTKMKFKIILKKDLLKEDHEFYKKVWFKRFFDGIPKPKCEVCDKPLGWEPLTTFFHHILEKRNFPQLRHHEKNIAILCPDCHSQYETFPDKVPYLVNLRKQLLEFFNLEDKKYYLPTKP